MRIISIDPGAKGAAVVWWASNTVKTYAGEGWATRLIADMLDLSENFTKVFIEKAQAMPGQGVSSMFRYGQSYG